MKKMNYIQPKSDVTSVRTDRFLMELLGSGSGPQPAPAHHTAPEVPGEGL